MVHADHHHHHPSWMLFESVLLSRQRPINIGGLSSREGGRYPESAKAGCSMLRTLEGDEVWNTITRSLEHTRGSCTIPGRSTVQRRQHPFVQTTFCTLYNDTFASVHTCSDTTLYMTD